MYEKVRAEIRVLSNFANAQSMIHARDLLRMAEHEFAERDQTVREMLDDADLEQLEKAAPPPESESPRFCDGCGLGRVHKKCIAHGTDAYMNPRHQAWGNETALEYLEQINRLTAKLKLVEELRDKYVELCEDWRDVSGVFRAVKKTLGEVAKGLANILEGA